MHAAYLCWCCHPGKFKFVNTMPTYIFFICLNFLPTERILQGKTFSNCVFKVKNETRWSDLWMGKRQYYKPHRFFSLWMFTHLPRLSKTIGLFKICTCVDSIYSLRITLTSQPPCIFYICVPFHCTFGCLPGGSMLCYDEMGMAWIPMIIMIFMA